MTPSPTPGSTPTPAPSAPPTGIDPISASLDAMHFSTAQDDDSVESITNQAAPSNALQGESTTKGGDDLESYLSGTDPVEDTKRSVSEVGIMMMGKDEFAKYCCGYVGTQNNSFCTKLRNQCSIQSHISSKFKPLPFRYYIYRSKAATTAWCQPTATEVELSELPNANETILKPTVVKSLKAWKAVFDAAKSLHDRTEANVDLHIAAFNDPLPYSKYKTPFKVKKQEYDIDEELLTTSTDIKAAIDYVSSETSEKFVSAEEEVVKDSMEKLLLTVHFLLEGFENLSKEIRNKAVLTDVAQDVTNLTASVAGLKADVGTNLTSPFPDLWTAVSELATLCSVEHWDQIIIEGSMYSILINLAGFVF